MKYIKKGTDPLNSYLNFRLAPSAFAWADARIKASVEYGNLIFEGDGFTLGNNFCILGIYCD